MSGHNALYNLMNAEFCVRDPGNAGTLVVEQWMSTFKITTTGVETRTLPQPTKPGMVCVVGLDVDGGDLTLTVTGGYNQADTATIVFGDAGDWVVFLSVEEGTSCFWRVLQHEGTNAVTTNATFTEATVTSLVATAATVTGPLRCQGDLIQTQPAPTTVADGDTAITVAHLLTRILTMAATQARAPTVPTGEALDAVFAVNESVDWSFINLAAGASTITVTAAAGHTLVGSMAIAQNVTGRFRTRVTAANTAITYRIG
jgi:hypothetical protein